MPNRIPGADLSADEIMVLQRIAQGYEPEEIAKKLLLPLMKERSVESSAIAKLGLVHQQDGRDSAGELYRRYGASIGFATHVVRKRKKEPKMNGVAHGGLGAKYASLPPKLFEVAGMVAQKDNTHAIASKLGVSMNEAGSRVSRLYAALGFDRSLGRERRTLVQQSFPHSGAAHDEVPMPFDAAKVAKKIGALDRADRNVLAEWIYADGDPAKTAKSLRITEPELMEELAGLIKKLGLLTLQAQQLAAAFKQGWAVYRGTAVNQPAASAPQAKTLQQATSVDIASLLLVPAVANVLADPKSVTAVRLAVGVAKESSISDHFAGEIETLRAQGFEPEIVITAPSSKAQSDKVQLLFVKRNTA